MASAPHYALFTSKGFVASRHDYSHHKEHYLNYCEYLVKSPQEAAQIPNDRDNRWANLCDSGYEGSLDDTPEERRVALKKAPLTQADRDKNYELARLRVPVEQFFGRLTGLWGIVRHTYKYDHQSFDADIDMCILLTNEHIRYARLTMEDAEFYRSFLSERIRQKEQRQEKRQREQENYRLRRQAKFQRVSNNSGQVTLSHTSSVSQ